MRAFDAGLRHWRQLPWAYLHATIGVAYNAMLVRTFSAIAHQHRGMNVNGIPTPGLPGTGLIIVPAIYDHPLDDEHRMITMHWHFTLGSVPGPQGPFNFPLLAAIGNDGTTADFVVQFDEGFAPAPNTSFSIEVDYIVRSCMQ